MTDSNTAADIRALLTEELDITAPSDHTDLIEEGLLDSLTFVELIFQLEVRFGVLVLPEHMEFENFRSVEKITQFVDSRRGCQSG